jgi:hypothetical protein
MLGDTANLIGCVYGHQQPVQVYTAIYFLAIDVVLVSQYCYYNYACHKGGKEHGEVRSDDGDIEETQPGRRKQCRRSASHDAAESAVKTSPQASSTTTKLRDVTRAKTSTATSKTLLAVAAVLVFGGGSIGGGGGGDDEEDPRRTKQRRCSFSNDPDVDAHPEPGEGGAMSPTLRRQLASRRRRSSLVGDKGRGGDGRLDVSDVHARVEGETHNMRTRGTVKPNNRARGSFALQHSGTTAAPLEAFLDFPLNPIPMVRRESFYLLAAGTVEAQLRDSEGGEACAARPGGAVSCRLVPLEAARIYPRGVGGAEPGDTVWPGDEDESESRRGSLQWEGKNGAAGGGGGGASSSSSSSSSRRRSSSSSSSSNREDGKQGEEAAAATATKLPVARASGSGYSSWQSTPAGTPTGSRRGSRAATAPAGMARTRAALRHSAKYGGKQQQQQQQQQQRQQQHGRSGGGGGGDGIGKRGSLQYSHGRQDLTRCGISTKGMAARTEALFEGSGTSLYIKAPKRRPANNPPCSRSTPNYEDVARFQTERKVSGLGKLAGLTAGSAGGSAAGSTGGGGKKVAGGRRRDRMNSAFRALPLETMKVVDDRHTWSRESQK